MKDKLKKVYASINVPDRKDDCVANQDEAEQDQYRFNATIHNRTGIFFSARKRFTSPTV